MTRVGNHPSIDGLTELISRDRSAKSSRVLVQRAGLINRRRDYFDGSAYGFYILSSLIRLSSNVGIVDGSVHNSIDKKIIQSYRSVKNKLRKNKTRSRVLRRNIF